MTKLFRAAALLAAAILAGGAALAGDQKAEKVEKDAKRLVEMGLQGGDKAAVIRGLQTLGSQATGKDAASFVVKVALNVDVINKNFSAEASNDIYDAAEDALAAVKDPAGEKYILEQLRKHKDVRVRVLLTDVMGKRRTDEAEKTLIEALLQDKDSLVKKAAVQHLGLRKSTRAFDAVIEVLAKVEKKREEPWLDCMRFLTSITGKDFEDAAGWKDWWAANKDKFDPTKATPGTTGAGGAGETVERKAPTFFDTTVLTKKCVFILDVSGSMAIKDPMPEGGMRKSSIGPSDPGYGEVPAERMRMHRLKEAMKKLIQELPEDTNFTIITFATVVTTWNQELVPANARNKQDAMDFAEAMNPEGYTVTDEALRASFDVQGDANTFYLFSDGAPQRGKKPDGTPDRPDVREILEEVERLNRTRKVKIFTIGMGDAMADFMRALAGANGGKFTAVQ